MIVDGLSNYLAIKSMTLPDAMTESHTVLALIKLVYLKFLIMPNLIMTKILA